MHTDREACLRAIRAKDARFDGRFFTGVLSTGIYCRPSCPARTAQHVQFYATAAAAQQAGFRACRRCLPGASPGSPEWDIRGDVVARAMRLIADGVVDRDGVSGLARHLGYSMRQTQRLIMEGTGASPLGLARARRAQTARTLLEATDLPLTELAFAAGFSSVRSFNTTMQEVYAATPTALRKRTVARATGPRDELTFVNLTMPVRLPFCPCTVFGHLIATAIDGVDSFREGWYHRTLRLPVGHGVVSLRPGARGVEARLGLTDIGQLPTAIARIRRLLDLDADPVAVDEHLVRDPALASQVAAHPGRRIPRSVDAEELAIRIVLGQHESSTAARTHGARLVAALGTPVGTGIAGADRLFPTAAAVASAPDELLAFPRAHRDTIRSLAALLASGDIELGVGADWDEARRRLLEVKGVSPWSVEMIAMRGLGDPDAFPATDLGLLRAAGRLSVADLAARSVAWRPWRSYATSYLWTLSPHAVNSIAALRGCEEQQI